jgi:hypothetical protein
MEEHFQETYFCLFVGNVTTVFGRCQPSGKLAKTTSPDHSTWEYLNPTEAALMWALHYSAVDYKDRTGQWLKFRERVFREQPVQ